MGDKKIILNFRQCDQQVFNAVLDGQKKVETRAASPKFKNLKSDDILILKCGKEKIEKKIKTIQFFPSIDELISNYKITDINPFVKNKAGLETMYYCFPNYREKINKYGLVAMEFKD